jgi:hypothetical protein
MRLIVFISILIFPVSCFEKQTVASDSERFSAPKSLAELTNKKLEEVSGIAASASNRGLLWAHNDSGNPAVIYLLDESLNIRLSCKMAGIKNRDWEDITVGPGPEEGKNYVYIGEIGDNNARSRYKYLYRFEEPVLGDQKNEMTITEFDTLVFELEGENKDTESIMIHPETKDIYLISKREKPVYLYQLKYPQNTGDTLTAKKLTSLPLTQIVSAAISPDSNEIIMKNYDNIYYWEIKDKSVSEALQEKPQVLKYTEEPQGEAITFSRDGKGFYTLSEKIKGEKVYLYFYGRQNQ